MIHVIEGDGRGKTTSAIGLCVRAAGHGRKVLFLQFLKSDTSGEIKILRGIPEISVCHSPVDFGFVFQMTEEQKKRLKEEYNRLLQIAIDSDAYLIVLDEGIDAYNANLIDRELLKMLLKKKSEIVLTGRNTPEWIVTCADYVSYVKKIKHPYDTGITARLGIEY